MRKNVVRLISLVLTLIVVFCTVAPMQSHAADEIVTIQFRDENLYNAIVKQLGTKIANKNDTNKTIQITRTNLNSVDRLELSGHNIQDMCGISEFTNLKQLYLISNQINDVSGLSNLTNLRYLRLDGNQISDISGLSSLTNLTDLYLDSNYQIRDISTLSNLTDLRALSLAQNQIRDISALSNLSKLQMLSLGNNQISDISVLSNLTNLEYLYLHGNQISDINALSSVTNLRILNLDYQKIYQSFLENDIDMIELPNCFKLVNEKKSLVYSEDGFSYKNCRLEDNKIIIEDRTSEAIVIVNGGSLYNSKFFLKPIPSKEIKFQDKKLYDLIANILKQYEENGKIPSNMYSLDEQTQTIVVAEDYIDVVEAINLSNKNIEDITGLEQFSNLKTLYLDNNPVKNIEKISSLNITALFINNTNINNLDKLKDFKELQILEAKNNGISSLSGIENLISLRTINFADNNISDVSNLANLPNLKYVHLNNNKITNISPIADKEYIIANFKDNNIKQIGNINYDKVLLQNNKITETLQNTKELNLPDIFKQALDSSSAVYSEESIYCEGCKIQGDKVVVENGVTEAKLVISSGSAKGTTLNISLSEDYTEPNVDVDYQLVNYYNGTAVKVTLTANEDIRNILGWDRVSSNVITKTFPYDMVGQAIVVSDLYGNETQKTLRYTGVVNEKIPGMTVNYSTLMPTQDDVTVTITSDSELHAGYSGWEHVGTNTKAIRKTYTQNTTGTHIVENILTEDMFNAQMQPFDIDVSINNIDRTAPDCDVEYSTTSLTDGNVVATIVCDERISVVNESGWNLKEEDGKYKLYKSFSENVSESLTVRDLAGNTSSVNINIANIDKNIANLTQEYSTLDRTFGSVTVNILADETIREVEQNGATLYATRGNVRILSNNSDSTGNEVNKTYTENTIEGIVVEDNAGNEDFIVANIQNIDNTELILSKPVYTTNSDGTVTVRVGANKEVLPIEGWNGWELSENKKVLTKIYDTNRKETIQVKDLAGHVAEAEIDVRTINPGLEILDVSVEEIDKTDELLEDYTDEEIEKLFAMGMKYKVTITASNEIEEVYGWKLSFGRNSISKLFTKNGKETVTIVDEYGNTKIVEIDVEKLLNGEQPEIIDGEPTVPATDNTQSPDIIPQTGRLGIPMFIIAGILFIISRKRYKKLKHIK